MKIVPLDSSNGAKHKNIKKSLNNSWKNDNSKRKINRKKKIAIRIMEKPLQIILRKIEKENEYLLFTYVRLMISLYSIYLNRIEN